MLSLEGSKTHFGLFFKAISTLDNLTGFHVNQILNTRNQELVIIREYVQEGTSLEAQG